MNDIYNDISRRTNGEILIGVVGPVRSGKSTFITKFMEELVIPNIVGKNKKQIAVDELPQSAQGKTVMTTEPKFVPGEAVTVKLDKAQAKVRLIDCVGYMVDGALGHEENGQPRLVKTPWQEEEMPFEKASEFGTHKVISEHSTIGIVITTDGSFSELERKGYAVAEERVIKELKSLNKPFIVLFNTVDENSEKTRKTCQELEQKYGVAVLPTNVTKLNKDSISEIFEKVLLEFPMRMLDVDLPKWMQALSSDNEIIASVMKDVAAASENIDKMSGYKSLESVFLKNDDFENDIDVNLDTAVGRAEITVRAKPELFYKTLSKECGEELSDEFCMFNYVRNLIEAKENYQKLKSALDCSKATGYGIVTASIKDASVNEPKVVKKNGRYCVKIKVEANSLHLINADVLTDVEVISGSKEQCDDFVKMISAEDGKGLETEVFGKPITNILEEKLSTSSLSLNDNVKHKLKRTINKAVNEKKGNLICMLL